MKKISKKGIKWLVVILGIIALIVAGVVLGITYWPAGVADVATPLQEYIETTSSDDCKEVKSFIAKYSSQFASNGKADYSNEMEAFPYIIGGMDLSMTTISYTMEGTIQGNISRTQVRRIKGGIDSVGKNLSNMANFLREHKDEISGVDTAITVWESVRVYYQNILEDYKKVVDGVYEIYSTHNLKGIYGNEVMVLSLKATGAYLEVIDSYFFGNHASKNSTKGLTVSKRFNTGFLNGIYSTHFDVLVEYYLKDDVAIKAEKIGMLEEKTEGKINFTYLITKDFSITSANLTSEQSEYALLAANFLKGVI